jgi:hypothetical protein
MSKVIIHAVFSTDVAGSFLAQALHAADEVTIKRIVEAPALEDMRHAPQQQLDEPREVVRGAKRYPSSFKMRVAAGYATMPLLSEKEQKAMRRLDGRFGNDAFLRKDAKATLKRVKVVGPLITKLLDKGALIAG